MECLMCDSEKQRGTFSFIFFFFLITCTLGLSGCGGDNGGVASSGGGGGGGGGGSEGFSISGGVFLSGHSSEELVGIKVELGGGGSGTATTNSGGIYTFRGLGNGSYTVTPLDANFTFSPAHRAVTINNANRSGQNFSALPASSGGGGGGGDGGGRTFSISGGVFLDGLSSGKLSGITMGLGGGGSGTATTNSDGIYTFTGLGNGSYTVTPLDPGYTFNPVRRTVTIRNANQNGQNFEATSVNP